MSNVKNLSLRKLASQLVIPRLSIEEYSENQDYKIKIHQLVNEGVGGFCIFGGSPQVVRNITDDLQIMSDIPLMFCADLENGLTMRLDNGTDFPHAMALGKANDEKTVRKVAATIGKEAKIVGINWNLSPVCDINSNENNPVINIRSFGETAGVVGKFSKAYIEGTQSQKVMSCAKHFPGHGNTDVDSHIGFPVLKDSFDEIDKKELAPFRKAIKAKVRSIMIGHFLIPALDGTDTPISLSKKAVEILREKLNFRGIILSDALDMRSITEKFESGEAALAAFKAGNDIILMPEDPFEVIDNLEKEITDNEKSHKQALDSAERLYKEKQWCGITLPMVEMDQKTLEHYAMEHQKLALDAAEPALKIIGRENIVPINEDSVVSGFSFVFGDEMDKGILFFKMLAQAIENDVHFGFVDDKITSEEILKLVDETKMSDLMIFSFFIKGRAYQKRIDITDRINEIMSMLAGKKETLVILFGDPYLSKKIKSKNIILTYSDSLPSIAAAVMKLSGRTANIN